jgi:single-stranded-DNA-specific exonuclease
MAEGSLRQWTEPGAVDVPAELRAAIGGHPLVAEILFRRGLGDLDAARAFLDPRAYQPCPAEELPGISAACERIECALEEGEPICVWGDFDVDGQTSTTLLVSALRGLVGEGAGERISYHIPVRARESHGVNWENLEGILAGGARLVITCDTGITSNEPLRLALERGVDVIVTDHHDLGDRLPEAFSITNPKLLQPGHPLYGLPGVGVAYKLAEALYERAGRGSEAESFLDLAALGIVADLAVQTADTRWLLQRGLGVLREARRTGLAMMMELANLQPGYLTEEHIGFVLAPRLNALGRLDDANPAVDLLTTSDSGRARVLATHLEGLNARRRLLTEQVLNGALAQIEKNPDLLAQAVLVLSHPEWPAGVIGIVASELAERFNRPTILLAAPPGQPARGSARSIDGVHITQAIAAQQKLLLGFGGHPMAAGLSLEAEKIQAFRRGISHYVEKALGGVTPRPSLALDGYITLPDLSLDLVSDLERLAPCGTGNPSPMLAIPRLAILSSSTLGRDGDHVQVMVKDEDDHTQRVIWWRGAGWPLPEGVFDLACVVRASNYRGQRGVQVEWIDSRVVEEGRIALKSPISVIDQRDQDHPLPVLEQMLAETKAEVWGEAEAVERIQARDRTRLVPAETLIIWTTPPGRSELEAAIDSVKPRTVVVFGVDPETADTEGFLRRLAGLVKYAVEKKGGEAAVSTLAAAAGQREAAVRLGLKWMQQRGMLRVTPGEGGLVHMAVEKGPVSAEAEETLAQLRRLIEETNAYRKYFRTAEKENLL